MIGRPPNRDLSEIEKDCLYFFLQGKGMIWIARKCDTTKDSVLWHLTAARRKLYARTSAQAGVKAIAKGLIDNPYEEKIGR